MRSDTESLSDPESIDERPISEEESDAESIVTPKRKRSRNHISDDSEDSDRELHKVKKEKSFKKVAKHDGKKKSREQKHQRSERKTKEKTFSLELCEGSNRLVQVSKWDGKTLCGNSAMVLSTKTKNCNQLSVV